MTDLWNVCKACKNSDLIMINGTCGLPTCSAVNSFKDFSPRENRGEKTLLDEFAMAALKGLLSSDGYVWIDCDIGGDGITGEEAVSKEAFEVAAAMMAERARRDETGNVKETTEQ